MAAILIKCPALGQSHMICHVTHSQGLLLRSQVKNPAKRNKISLDLGRNNENILLLIYYFLCLWILCARMGLYSFWLKGCWKRVEKHGWQWLHETDLLTKHKDFRIKKVTLARNLRAGEEHFISNRRKIFFPASNAGSNGGTSACAKRA